VIAADESAFALLVATVRHLLASCGEHGVAPDDDQLERAAAAVTDWDTVGKLAHRHAFGPLLHQALQALPTGAVPTAVLDATSARAEATRVRNLALAGELTKVVDALEQRGLQPLPYKGPVLAVAAYGDLGLREFVDLDVLMPADQIREGHAALLELGYEVLKPMSPRWERHQERHGHDRKFVRADRFVVELQWALADRASGLPRDLGPLFGRASTVALGPGGRRVPTLSPEDQVLVLAIHGGLHLWERLAWVADLARALSVTPTPDAQAILRRATRAGARRTLLAGLGVEAAEVLARALAADPKAEEVARDVSAKVLRADHEPSAGAQLRLHLAMKDGTSARVLSLVRYATVPTESDRLAVRLPDALYPLYYPVRFARLTRSYAVGDRRPGDVVIEA
jgi:Uncharacterised nucleotidyltransferase